MGKLMFGEVTTTWNPVVGCTHNCAYCYARKLQQSRLKHFPQYKDFEPKLIEHKLEELRRFDPSRDGYIFVVDMGDLFCEGVPDEWIDAVLNAIWRQAKIGLRFLFLTKNPIRYLDWLEDFSRLREYNIYIALGATIETNLNYSQIRGMPPSNAPSPIARLYAMKYLRKKWDGALFISIEPILEFNIHFREQIREIEPDWVYIGYDNHRNYLPEPELWWTETLIGLLENDGITVKKKSLRRAWYEESDADVYQEEV